MAASQQPAFTRTIFHVDMDAFFVSVEELFDPSLKSKAVVVGGNRDERGVVSAASYEARKFGVHSAMPLRTAARMCPHAIFVNGHPERYRECSEKVYKVLGSFSPQVEMASIDEAYLDMTGTERLHGHGQQLARALRQALGPTGLLHLESVHFHGKFRRAVQARHVDELPAFQLRAVTEVGIFGERIVLPAAGVLNRLAAQNTGRAVEVEEVARARASPVLQDEVPVQQHGFHFGEEAVIAIQIAPAGLHDADSRVGEMLDGAREEIRRRDEIGIENGDEFACGGLQSFLQRAGFEALAIVAVMVFDGEPQSAIALHQRRGKWGGVVGGIVQHLDLEQLAGILDAGDLVDEPLDDVPFVEDGQLNGDRRQLREASGRLAGGLLAVLEVGADHLITMHTVDRKQGQDGEVRYQNRPVEPTQLVDAAKGVVEQAAHHAGCGRTRGQKCNGEQGGYHSAMYTIMVANRPSRNISIS